MIISKVSKIESEISKKEITNTLNIVFDKFSLVKRALIIHPDYSRNDFSHLLTPIIIDILKTKSLKTLDTLNAAGTHRKMGTDEIIKKLGVNIEDYGTIHNHNFDNQSILESLEDIPGSFIKEQTNGNLSDPLPVTVNKLINANYDLIITLNGTVPHEAAGYSGGTKILVPGISGPKVVGGFHWAAVMVGIPAIIGSLDNPARRIINKASTQIMDHIKTPVISLNMVYTEDDDHKVIPKGLFTGIGMDGFSAALDEAAKLSSKLHIKYLKTSKDIVIQELPKMYDEVWTAGKGSYKLQKKGVLSKGAKIVLYAPHIDCFHSNKKMDKDIRKIGYHGIAYVLNFLKENPEFDRNIASHVINVRGFGELKNNIESFPFEVVLATKISKKDCESVNLGYIDPNSLKKEDFQAKNQLWIDQGGQWLYDKKVI